MIHCTSPLCSIKKKTYFTKNEFLSTLYKDNYQSDNPDQYNPIVFLQNYYTNTYNRSIADRENSSLPLYYTYHNTYSDDVRIYCTSNTPPPSTILDCYKDEVPQICKDWNDAVWIDGNPNYPDTTLDSFCSESENQGKLVKNCNALFKCDNNQLVKQVDRPAVGPDDGATYTTVEDALIGNKNSIIGKCLQFGFDYENVEVPYTCYGAEGDFKILYNKHVFTLKAGDQEQIPYNDDLIVQFNDIKQDITQNPVYNLNDVKCIDNNIQEVDFVECQGIQKFDDTLINQTNILLNGNANTSLISSLSFNEIYGLIAAFGFNKANSIIIDQYNKDRE